MGPEPKVCAALSRETGVSDIRLCIHCNMTTHSSQNLCLGTRHTFVVCQQWKQDAGDYQSFAYLSYSAPGCRARIQAKHACTKERRKAILPEQQWDFTFWGGGMAAWCRARCLCWLSCPYQQSWPLLFSFVSCCGPWTSAGQNGCTEVNWKTNKITGQ